MIEKIIIWILTASVLIFLTALVIGTYNCKESEPIKISSIDGISVYEMRTCSKGTIIFTSAGQTRWKERRGKVTVEDGVN